MTANTVLTQTQAAAQRGVTTRRLRQMGEDPIDPPTRDEQGKYPARDFLLWCVRNEFGSAEKINYNDERARLTKAQADEKELQVDQLRGDLIPSDQVIDMLETVIANARAKLLTLPIKLAQAALAATELKEIEREAEALIYEALAELSNGNSQDTGASPQEMDAAASING